MSRIFSRISVSLIALIGIIACAAFFLSSKLPGYLSDKLSEALKVAVSIKDIHLSYNNITLDDVVIGNVPKGILPKAFSAKKIFSDCPLTNYIKQKIEIDQIGLNDVYLGLEFDSPSSTKSNWSKIMKSLSSSEDTSSKDKKVIFIKTLILTNIQVDLVYRNKPGEIKKLRPIDKIELHNINSEEGIPMNQLMNTVLGQMLKSVFIQENLKEAVKDLLQSQDSIDSLLSPLEGIFGK